MGRKFVKLLLRREGRAEERGIFYCCMLAYYRFLTLQTRHVSDAVGWSTFAIVGIVVLTVVAHHFECSSLRVSVTIPTS